jgi:hypothetical protein
VDDYNASVRWGFYFEVRVFGLRSWTQIRKARLVAVGTLAMLAWVTAASAGQTSTADSTAKKPATTTTTSHKTHKSTAKSSSTGGTKSASTHTASGKHSSHKKSAKVRGQQKIDSERAQAIQEALIREHYMTGEASGTWNEASEEAMRRYQADHGWQSKTVPDSRALIKLGLGPSKEHLLNPESAMTTVPDAPRAESMPTTSHSTSPAADPATPTNPNDSRPQ